MSEPRQSEYAASGVDYRKIAGFKQAMVEMGKRTYDFPRRRLVEIFEGGVHDYFGSARVLWKQVTEGLGNKNWIASWMETYAGDGRSYHEGIGIDTMRMATNDLLPFRALPVVYTDEVAAGKDAWFTESPQRMGDVVESYYRGAQEDGCAITQGESPALKYLINTLPEPDLKEPVFHCPSFSGCVTGIIAPAYRWHCVTEVQNGDVVIGVPSSDWHCNGASMIIRKAMTLPDRFLTKLPNGQTLGEAALAVTSSYVALVERLLDKVTVRNFQPITGGGITKLAKYKIPFRYRIHTWPVIPPVCEFMWRQFGLSVEDSFTTFNNGVGFCIVAPEHEAARILQIGMETGHRPVVIGEVIKGDGDVKLDFKEGEGKVLRPPDD